MSDTPTQFVNSLDEIIAGYLAAEESGEAPPPAELLAAHPELADDLRRFFANRDEFVAALPDERRRPRFVPPKVGCFGDYELLDEIARGGMGVVYKARQRSLSRTVALKMILSGHLASEEDVQRFRTEAESAASLQHPGIVPVHEVGEHEGQHYFSMDYIEGRSLMQIARDNPLPASCAATYVSAIAEAVHYAHQQGTLHRDLKPSNILIDADDHVHVTDFGLAARVDGKVRLTQTGQIVGTPSFMAPEQAQCRRDLIGPASDVYSLGATLYALLTGRPPFRAESTAETLRQVIETDPVSLRLLNPKVPRDLETICLKCLQKEPHKRYVTAGELREDLQRFLAGESIRARPVGLIESSWRWCRRNSSAAGLLAFALLLVVGVFSGALWCVHDQGVRAVRIARLEQGIEDALGNAHELRELSWTMTDRPTEWAAVLSLARSAQKRAESLIDQEPDGIDPALRLRVDELRRERDADTRDQELAARVDVIRAGMMEFDESTASAYPELLESLAAIGVSVGQTAVNEAAEKIQSRPAPVTQVRIAALDFCLTLAPEANSGDTEWIQAALRAVDPDPWRGEVRTAIGRRNRTQLLQFAREADVAAHPASLLISLASALCRSGDDSDAVSLLRRLYSVRPADYWVNHWLGVCLLSPHLSRPELAARHFQAALALRSEHAPAWWHFGRAMNETNDPYGARAAFEQAIVIEPDCAVAHNDLAATLADLGEMERAVAEWRIVIGLQPDDANAHFNLGRALRKTGRLAEAVEELQTAADLEPDNTSFLQNLAEASLEAGDLRHALPAFQRWSEREPFAFRVAYERAALLHFVGDTESYQAFCRLMHDRYIMSRSTAGRHEVLMAHLFFPGADVSAEILSLAKRHAGDGSPVKDRMLGLAHYRRNEYEEALPLLQRAASAPGRPNSRIVSLLCLGLVQLGTDNPEDATRSIEVARTTQENSPEEAGSPDRKPWGVVPSLWREVEAAMEAAGLDEPISELPPTYEDWMARSAPTDVEE